MSTHTTPFPSAQESVKSKLSSQTWSTKYKKAKWKKVTLPALQTFKMRDTVEVDYHSNVFANSSPRYDDTILSYVSKLAEKVNLEIEAHLFVAKDRIFVIEFLTVFKLPCDMKNIHEDVVMWLLHYYVQKTPANTLNSRICAQDRLASLAASVRNEQPRSSKLVRSYSKGINCLLKKLATN